MIKDECRRRGMCYVREFRGAKNDVNSSIVQNVCPRNALVDSSSNKQQLQGNNAEKFHSH